MSEENEYKRFDTIALLVGVAFIVIAIVMAFIF